MGEQNSKKFSNWTIVMMVLTCVAWTAWIVCRLTVGGMCAKPSLASNFDKSLYLGRWYQMYQAKTVPFGTDCITATYSDLDGTNIRVNNQQFTLSKAPNGWGNWKGTPPAGGPDRLFKAHCSDWTTGHCQVKPFLFSPWNDYKVVDLDTDPNLGYSLVYGCDTFIAGAVKLDWIWVITRQALVIGSADWNTVKSRVKSAFADRLPSYNFDTFMEQTIEGTSEGCQYTPCLASQDEIGLQGC